MTDDLLDLAREAVTLPGWRWMPGMLAAWPGPGVHPGIRLVEINDNADALREHGWAVDLADPATLGCLLALVREAWPAATLCRVREAHAPPGRWVWCWRTIDDGGDYGRYRLGPSPFASRLYSDEAHALVAALRAGGSRD